jgi:hypothetical protein
VTYLARSSRLLAPTASSAKAPPGFSIITQRAPKTYTFPTTDCPTISASQHGPIRLRTEPAVRWWEPTKPPILLVFVLKSTRLRTLNAFSGRIWGTAYSGISVAIWSGVQRTGSKRADGHGRVRAADWMACSFWHGGVCGHCVNLIHITDLLRYDGEPPLC